MKTELALKAAALCAEITSLIDRKNQAYGDSALNPLAVFSKADVAERLAVRIDDKLSRIARGVNTDAVPEDTLLDLIGYLLIYYIHLKEQK